MIRAVKPISDCSMPFMHQGKKMIVSDELTLSSGPHKKAKRPPR